MTHNSLLLNHVLYVLDITKKLLSISQILTDNDVVVEFVEIFYFIEARKRGILLHRGVAKEGLYQIQEISSSLQVSSECSSVLCCRDLYNKPISIFVTFSNSNVFNSFAFTGINKPCNQTALLVYVFPFDINLLHQRFGHQAPHT